MRALQKIKKTAHSRSISENRDFSSVNSPMNWRLNMVRPLALCETTLELTGCTPKVGETS